MAATAASKAKDLAHDAADTAARARQQALEAAGVADKTDDDDTLPELRCEPHTRRFYFSARYTSHWPVGCSAGFSRSSKVSRPSAASDAAIMCGVFAASPPATITRTARTASAFACSPDARRSAAAVRPRRNSKAAARVLTLTCSHVATRV